MDPRAFTVTVTLVYGLYATLGIFELVEALEHHYRVPLCIGLFISNAVYPLVIIAAAFHLIVTQDGFPLGFAFSVYGVAKVVFSSIAITYLRDDKDTPRDMLVLFIIEIILVFFPIFIGLCLAICMSLIDSVTLISPLTRHQFWIWMSLIILFAFGVIDIVQAVTEDYLRTFFILTAVANMVLPTLSVLGSANINPDAVQGGNVHIIFAWSLYAKLALAGFALHAVIVDRNTSVLAQVACYLEIIPLLVPIALGLVAYFFYKFYQCLLFCLKFNQVQQPTQQDSNIV